MKGDWLRCLLYTKVIVLLSVNAEQRKRQYSELRVTNLSEQYQDEG